MTALRRIFDLVLLSALFKLLVEKGSLEGLARSFLNMDEVAQAGILAMVAVIFATLVEIAREVQAQLSASFRKSAEEKRDPE